LLCKDEKTSFSPACGLGGKVKILLRI
jgi:hypothetical protein